MSTFNAFLDQISTTQAPTSSTRSSSTEHPFTLRSEPHNNPHATPTPVDMASLYRLVQDQFATLASTSDSSENIELLRRLVRDLETDVNDPPTEVRGVSAEFLADLDRVPRKKLGDDDCCPICNERYLDDQYCLVVGLPCHRSHRFDLECVGPWLQSKGSCPLCRKSFIKEKEKVVEDSEEEDEDGMGMFS
jgi:hypothetical protein